MSTNSSVVLGYLFDANNRLLLHAEEQSADNLAKALDAVRMAIFELGKESVKAAEVDPISEIG